MQQQGGQVAAALDARLRRYSAPQYAQAAQNGQQAREQMLSRSGQGGNTGSSRQLNPQVGLQYSPPWCVHPGVLLGFRSTIVLMLQSVVLSPRGC